MFIFTILILISIFTIFFIIGDFYREKQIKEIETIKNNIVKIHELNYEINSVNDEIIIYENKLDKINFISQLKRELNIIFFDRKHFDVENINKDHLYFMECQRAQYKIPKHIYYRLIFAESGFKMFNDNGNVLRSSGGAMGYMQILGSTFNSINHTYDLNLNDITNPYDNIIAGTFYLNKRKSDIDKLFPNANEEYKWKLAIASYNAGIEDVKKAKGIPKIRYHTSSRFKYGDVNNETIKYVNFITKNFKSNEQLLAML